MSTLDNEGALSLGRPLPFARHCTQHVYAGGILRMRALDGACKRAPSAVGAVARSVWAAAASFSGGGCLDVSKLGLNHAFVRHRYMAMVHEEAHQ